MTRFRAALIGEILMLLGTIAIACGLILGWGHWRFEVPAAAGFAAMFIGRRVRGDLL